MGYSIMWVLVPAPAGVVERYGPRLRPLVEAEAALPSSRELWARWEQGLLDGDGLLDVACGPLGEHLDVLYEAWDGCADAGAGLAVSARNRYPVAGLAHGLGPERFAALPGWFGDLLLDPDEVRASLPAVEAAFALDATAYEAAVDRAYVLLNDAYRLGELFDGVLPVWRAAAEAGHGLIGAQIVP
ncbi:hypothetical protein [Kitasatospora sp. NPDC097643]|uniref:hypothetical protein n=1 Tax=Kitasatospora sp. NPDC097643 TaxID=3157230 RepID=UPI00332309F0